MTALILALLVIVLISAAIVLVVALPHLRSGSRILTPAGERTVQQAREQSRTAVTSTGRWVGGRTAAAGSGLRRRLPGSGDPGGTGAHRASTGEVVDAGASDGVRRRAHRRDPGDARRGPIGAPRPSPVDSGPIAQPQDGSAVAGQVAAEEPAPAEADGAPARHAR